MSFKRAGWRIYKEQMSQLDHGYALWEPAPIHSFKRIQLGDVGYVRRGRFHLLFSAGCPLGERTLGTEVPITFMQLNVGPIIYSQPRVPGYLCTNTVRETGASLGASTCAVPMLEPGVSFSFELTEQRGAVLVTKYPTYREDVELESVFKAYTKRHYDSWVAFACDTGHGDDIKPVLVTGVEMTKDFAMMAYSNDSVGLESRFTTATPMIGSSSTSAWGTWRTGGLVHTNCGPQLCCPPSSTQATGLTPSDGSNTDTVADEYNQCVFIRYYSMRKRAGIFPAVIGAAAGPHDLGSEGRGDGKLYEVETQFISDPDTVSSLWDEDESDDGSSITSIDSGSDIVVHNTTSDEEDDFDIIANYVFRNSNAESVLIHHQDIALLRQSARGGTDISTLLLEKRPPIAVDGIGVGTIECQAYPPRDNSSNATHLALTLHDPVQ